MFELIACICCYPSYVGEASGCDVVNEFITFQIAAICGLVGMTLGWRGVMTKYSGFYDLPTAWNQVFWGILLGGAYASTAHNWLFIPYLETGASGERAGELNLINLILITLIATIAMHFLLRRKRIRKGGSHATSGWGLGLAVGGMFSIVLIMYKVMAGVNGIADVLTIVLIAFFAPRAEALITSYHGVLMLRGKRWGAIFRATFWRARIHYHVLFRMAQSSCMDFHHSTDSPGAGISRKMGVEFCSEGRTTTLASYAGRQKEGKTSSLQGLFRHQTALKLLRNKFAPFDFTYQWFGRSSHTTIKP